MCDYFESNECKNCKVKEEAKQGLYQYFTARGIDTDPCFHCSYAECTCKNCIHGPYPCEHY